MKNDFCCSRIDTYTPYQIALCKQNEQDQKNCKDNFDTCIGSCLDNSKKEEILKQIKEINSCKDEITKYYTYMQTQGASGASNSGSSTSSGASNSGSPTPSSEHFTNNPASTSRPSGNLASTSGPSGNSASTSGSSTPTISSKCSKYTINGSGGVAAEIRKEIITKNETIF